MQNKNNIYTEESVDNGLHLREVFNKYFKHWKWFLLTVITFLFLAKLYLRYSIPEYKALATILIKDEKSGNIASELSAFEDLGLFKGSKKNIDDEIEVLKSRALIEKTVKRGNFNISYISEGRIKSSDVYGAYPIEINFLKKDERFYAKDSLLNFNILSEHKFELYNQKNELVGTFPFDKEIPSEKLGSFVVSKKELFNKEREIVKVNSGKIIVQISSLKKATESFKSRLSVASLSKFSNVVEISTIDPVGKKAEDFLNALVEVYNEDAIADKNIISEKTAKFVNERLGIITEELAGVELSAESYKRKNKITDLVTEAELNLKNASAYNTEQASVGAQIKVVEVMLDYLKTAKEDDIIPVNIIPSGESSSAFIAEYNSLIVEKNRLLKSSTPSNPVIIRIDEKINSLRSTIWESLKKVKNTLVVKDRSISREGGVISGKISQIPKQEREFRNIGRQQQIKEELYLYLFKKREETAITLAVTAPISKVVDKAYSSEVPVSPKRQLIYLMAIAFGLFIPFLILYLKDLLDTKVKTKDDLNYLNIPFVGDVPHSDSNNEIIQRDSRTSSAEAIRIVRTNLEFIINNIDSKGAKTIFLTSTLPAEGKTFIAVNLAATIALSGKKVLLVGLDIRNPKLDEYIKIPNRGVTNYLSSDSNSINDFIVKQEGYQHFDVLPSGVIPPNPAELLMSKKVEGMFDTLKEEYDYIIVDTAPISLVTDTLLISRYANSFIYVVRANYLEKQMLHVPESLYKDKKLSNMCILLNDTDSVNGYGYGYIKEPKKSNWFQKLFSIFG